VLKNLIKRQRTLDDLKHKSSLDMPVFILVRPQLAENIGMAARAMMNCGIYDLRVVSPKVSVTYEKALSASSGADAILKSAKVFDSVDEAVSDLKFVMATTARSREVAKPVITTCQLDECLNTLSLPLSSVGVLFGCERTGLENTELTLADILLTVPLNFAHTSLNLSQAVLLVGYAFFTVMSSDASNKAETPKAEPATKGEISAFLNKLNLTLTQKGYYSADDKRPKMENNLNNIFLQRQLSSHDIRTLHSVLRFLTKK